MNQHEWYLANRSKVLEHNREYNIQHREQRRIYSKRSKDKIKEQVHQFLGNKCSKCGYFGLALQIDHVNGGGKREWLRFKGSRYSYLKFIFQKLQSGSRDYQLLCANCNWEKRFKKKEDH